MKSLRPLALKCSWSCNVWGGEGGWRQTTLHLQPTAMEEFTRYPVTDQEEARPPLFLDQTEARDRPPCLRVWMIAPLPPPLPLIWRSAPQSPTNSPSRLSTLPHSPTNSPSRRSSLPHSQPKVLENFPPYPREAWIEGNIFFLPCLLSDQGTKLTKTQLAQQLGALVLTWKISTPTSLNMSSNKATPQTTSTCMLPDSH